MRQERRRQQASAVRDCGEEISHENAIPLSGLGRSAVADALNVLGPYASKLWRRGAPPNPKRLTASPLILLPMSHLCRLIWVRLDRTVPVAGCVGSRDPCPATTNSTGCGANPPRASHGRQIIDCRTVQGKQVRCGNPPNLIWKQQCPSFGLYAWAGGRLLRRAAEAATCQRLARPTPRRRPTLQPQSSGAERNKWSA